MFEIGNLFVIAAPSGTGKTTLVGALATSVPHLTISISHTTRPKRSSEKEGVNYYFINEAKFQGMIKNGEFLEYATIFKHLYGTSKRWVETTLARGLDMILEIDWQGCQQIQRLFPDCISIFILPPSLPDLIKRLRTRNQDKPEIIQERLADIEETISHIKEFQYVVINDNFNKAVEDLKTIVHAGRLLQKRQTLRCSKLLAKLSAPTPHPDAEK